MLVSTQTETIEVHVVEWGSDEYNRLRDQINNRAKTYKGYPESIDLESFSETKLKITITYRK